MLQHRRPKKTHLYDEVYGPGRVWLADDPYSAELLARLCSPKTRQPHINKLVIKLYEMLIQTVVNVAFPRCKEKRKTRMHAQMGERGVLVYERPHHNRPVSICAMYRAGSRPADVCFDELTGMIDPDCVTQDCVAIARKKNRKTGGVDGARVKYFKTAMSWRDRILLIPDCMGATGGSIKEVLRAYRRRYRGSEPLAIITMHLIVTPEYLQRVLPEEPNLSVFAFRIDRGMSDPEVQASVPGTYPDREFGLNEHDYIVPGAGGLGELICNANC